MGIMTGKKGIIFGVSNKRGIAYAIAEQLYKEGAEIAFTYAGEVMKDRVTPIAEEMKSKMIMSCDVSKDHEVKAVFDEYKKFMANVISSFTLWLLPIKKIWLENFQTQL